MRQLKPHECFKGNLNLKRSGVIIPYSEEDVREVIKCKEDIIYFIEKYVKIISTDDGKVSFNLYDYQKNMIEAYRNNKQVICLTCRQAGKCVTGRTCIDVTSPDGSKYTTSIGDLYELLRNQTSEKRRRSDEASGGIVHMLSEILPGGEMGYRRCPKDIDVGRIVPENKIKKFIGKVNTDGWLVNGPHGMVPIKYIHKTIPYEVWDVDFESGKTIHCADNHIFITSYGRCMFASDIYPGIALKSQKGYDRVISVRKTHHTIEMYDAEIKRGYPPLYYTNGIVSHNTTTSAAFLLWEMIFNTDIQVGILANKAATAQEILDRLKMMYEGLPLFLQPGVEVWNKKSIELANNCKAISSATSASSIRGLSLSILYLDEFSHIKNDTEFFTSTYPVISSGKKSKVIITSTPNGMNLFYRLWADATDGKNDFFPIKFTWRDHPNRDEEWKEKTLKILGSDSFAQEHEGEFMGSSGTLISGTKLKVLKYRDPIRTAQYYKEYASPIAEGIYVACIDVSEGVGLDYSVCTIIRVDKQPFEICAVFRHNEIPPDALAEFVYPILRAYNEPFCVIETNGIGTMVANNMVYELEYENILMTESKQGDINPSEKSKSKLGIKQTSQTKRIGCARLKQLIESDSLEVNDYDLLQELYSFSRKGKSYQAEKDKNDDIVMTLVLFGWLFEQDIFQELVEEEFKKTIREKYLKSIGEDSLPFGFIDDGTSDTEEYEFSRSLNNTHYPIG